MCLLVFLVEHGALCIRLTAGPNVYRPLTCAQRHGEIEVLWLAVPYSRRDLAISHTPLMLCMS